MGRNYHSRWGELDLVAVKPAPDGFENEMCFDDAFQKMSDAASAQWGNSVHFVDATHATTIPCCGVVISARNRLTPQFMGFL